MPSGVPQAAHSVLSMSVMRCGGGEGRAECVQQRRTMMLLLLLQRNENRHSCGSCRSTRRPEKTADSCLKRASALPKGKGRVRLGGAAERC